MSSILKALQKLEEDKAARKTKEPDISSAIIKNNRPAATKRAWLIPVLIVMTAFVSILATYAIVRTNNTTALPSKTPVQTESISTSPPNTGTFKPELKESPAASKVENNKEVHPQVNEILKSKQQTKESTATPLPMKKQSPPITAVSKQNDIPPPVTEQPIEIKPVLAVPQKPNLSITGIAWQKDNSSRLAVINGIQVVEGGMVEGAKVVEIFPDKVKLSFGGESFELTMGRNQGN